MATCAPGETLKVPSSARLWTTHIRLLAESGQNIMKPKQNRRCTVYPILSVLVSDATENFVVLVTYYSIVCPLN